MKLELALLSLLTIAGVGLFNYNPAQLQVTSESYEISQYNQWKQKFGIYYSQEEDSYRFSVFIQNLKEILELNSKTSTTTFGLNHLSAMTLEEIKTQQTGIKTPQNYEVKNFSTEGPINQEKLDQEKLSFLIPPKVDWTERGAVGEASDQGMCGSCWAFITVGALEGLQQIKTGSTTRLSEQQLLSCTEEPAFLGCHGAWSPYFGFDYAREMGMQSLESYPYEQFDYDWESPPKVECRYDGEQVIFKPKGYEYLANPKILDLLMKINKQPIAALVEVNGAFVRYKEGVLSEEDCPSTWDTLNHAVLISGYDLTHNPPYLLARNSWGPKWGDNGFIKLELSFDENGTCGINRLIARPL